MCVKINILSDTHLEMLSSVPEIPVEKSTGILLLVGDIGTFGTGKNQTSRIDQFFDACKNKFDDVIYIAGNHEYYGMIPIPEVDEMARNLCGKHGIHFLQNESIEINGVSFFGGTMWTDLDYGNFMAMVQVRMALNDYKRIMIDDRHILSPDDVIALHEQFCTAIRKWNQIEKSGGKTVVISHHCPSLEYDTNGFPYSAISHAFSLSDDSLIREIKPDLWVFGHTHSKCGLNYVHECGKITHVVSNPMGYFAERFKTLEIEL